MTELEQEQQLERLEYFEFAADNFVLAEGHQTMEFETDLVA